MDIGSRQIKVAELKKGGRGVEVTALGVAPTPVDAYENSTVLDPQALGQAVKALLKQSGITARKCVSSVSGQSAVVVRVIDVPQMDTGELAEAMKWEAERHVPFSINDTVMDYAPIERPEPPQEGQNMDVLLAVAQTDMIERHVEVLQAAGLKPEAVDVEPLAFGRMLLDMGGADEQASGHTVMIVNLGAAGTDIAIFRDKLPTLIRSLPTAGDSFTKAISDAMLIDMGQAEEYKQRQAEVFLEQMAQPTTDFDSRSYPDYGGFVDFTVPDAGAEPPATEASPLSGSGRMPFDFFQPPEQAAGQGSQSGSLDMSQLGAGGFSPTGGSQSGSLSASPSGSLDPYGSGSGSLDPHGSGSLESQPGFFEPAAPPAEPYGGGTNLPATTPSASSADPLKLQVFHAIVPVLQELSQELKRSLEFHRAKMMDNQVHEVLLIGGTASIKNLPEYIQAELGIPTKVANPFDNVQVSSKNMSAEHMAELAPIFPISIGLGSYSLVGGPIKKGKRK